MESWEVIIIGAGPAGLTAGIYAARSGLKTLVIEEKIAGGAVMEAPVIENYPGFERISGMELAQKFVEQCRSLGAVIHEFEKVEALKLNEEEKIVETNKDTYRAKAVIIASGSSCRELGVPGEKEFRGKGISYCGVCDGPLFKGKRVLVIGGGNSAVATALYLADLASDVKVVHRRDVFRAEEARVKALMGRQNVEVFWNTEVREIKGKNVVEKVVLFNNKTMETFELSVDGIFIQVGEIPNSKFAREAGVEVDEHGYIVTDTRQRTNILGVYAAGDVTNHPVKQVGTAVGQGITAALEAYGYVRRPYYYKY
jgi:thioredoxin reductase (NADPH)